MAAQVEAVLFDVDNTLCEYHRTADELLPLAFEDVGVEPFFGPAEYYGRYEEFTDESEDVRDLRERCFAAIAADRGRDPDVGRAVARAYAAERDHTNVFPREGAREALEVLTDSYRVGAVTNGGPGMQSTKLSALGFVDYFETVVHAGYDAPAKPAPEPFHLALDALGVAPDRAVHVGDSLQTDVTGARNAGLDAAWLRRRDEVADHQADDPEYVLESVRELVREPWA
jgi:putative hydrolase of the HAD superfamily